MALTAAETILDREGVAGLSTRKIASEIGYAVGSLYLVFENLDDLIVQLNFRTLNQLDDSLNQAARRGGDPRAGLIELGRAYVQFASSYQSRWELIFGHRLNPVTMLPEDYRRQVRALFGRVEGLLAILAPHRLESDRALAARALWSGVHGVCTLALSEKFNIAGIADADKLTDSLIVNYLAGWRGDSAVSHPLPEQGS
ncbi:MAG: TetR/AcrR family transcriptional regulator [Methylomagnum sp.]